MPRAIGMTMLPMLSIPIPIPMPVPVPVAVPKLDDVEAAAPAAAAVCALTSRSDTTIATHATAKINRSRNPTMGIVSSTQRV
jgi:hypothetical protein